MLKPPGIFPWISWNHRIVRVGRHLWRPWSPTPLPSQGHLKHVTQPCVQVGFELSPFEKGQAKYLSGGTRSDGIQKPDAHGCVWELLACSAEQKLAWNFPHFAWGAGRNLSCHCSCPCKRPLTIRNGCQGWSLRVSGACFRMLFKNTIVNQVLFP